MNIRDLTASDADVQLAAQLLLDGFADNWPNAWPTLDSALEEVRECLAEGYINRVVVADDGAILGWVGGRPEYDGNVWELHPLVVRQDQRGNGIGQALVIDFEDRARERGGITIMLGTDDENDMTSLSGVDLYDNLWEHIASIQNRRGHPYTFYQRLGYTIVGVIPDANGPGKPDIWMAKRISSRGAGRN